MVRWKKNLLFVWLSQICSTAAFSSAMPFIPLFMEHQYGIADEAELGFYTSMFNFLGYLSFCAAAPLWGMLADRYGRKLMLLRACFVSALIFPLLYFAPNIYTLIGVRFLISIFSGTVTAAQTLIAVGTPEDHQGFALGTLSTALWSGNMVGFMVGSSIVHYFGFFCGFLSSAFLLTIAGLNVLLFVKEDFQPSVRTADAGKKKHGSLFAAFSGWNAAVWIVMGLFVMMGFARRFDEAYLPIMLKHLVSDDMITLSTGWISTAAALGGIVSGVVLGKLCDRWSPLKVAYPAIFVAVAGSLIQASAMNVVPFGVARFAAFFAAGGLEPAFLTMLSTSIPAGKRGTLFGIASSLRQFGILLAALLGGGVIILGGVRAVFYTSAALYLALLPMVWIAARIKAKNAAFSSISGESSLKTGKDNLN